MSHSLVIRQPTSLQCSIFVSCDKIEWFILHGNIAYHLSRATIREDAETASAAVHTVNGQRLGVSFAKDKPDKKKKKKAVKGVKAEETPVEPAKDGESAKAAEPTDTGKVSHDQLAGKSKLPSSAWWNIYIYIGCIHLGL